MTTAQAASTTEVAHELVDLCRKGEFNRAMEALYADNIVSVEGCEMPNMPREIRGLDGVRRKAQWFDENNTINACTVTGPFVAKDKFAVLFALDITEKATAKRSQMTEVAVYTVENGKITREEFLYQEP